MQAVPLALMNVGGRGFLAVIVLSMLILIGCGPRLHDEEAATLVKSSGSFREPKVVAFSHGWMTYPGTLDPEDINAVKHPVQLYLLQLGFVEVRGCCSVEVNPKQSHPDLMFKGGGPPPLGVAVLANRELDQISGISQEGVLAKVEYRWRWAPTELGKSFTRDGYAKLEAQYILRRARQIKEKNLGQASSERGFPDLGRLQAAGAFVDERETHTSLLTVRRFDTGWRIEP